MKVHLSGQVMLKAKADGVSMSELAAHLDMSTVVLGRILRGEQEMAPEKADLIEDKLKIKLPDKVKIKVKP